jgi:hypothetical protein
VPCTMLVGQTTIGMPVMRVACRGSVAQLEAMHHQ